MPKKNIAGTAADPTVRFTPLTLNGQTYQLAYDFEAIAQAEELTGLSLLVGVNWSQIGVRQIRAMLYASLLKAQPKITLDDLTPLLTVRNIAPIERALAAAWVESTPDPEKKDEPGAEPANEPNE